MKMKRIYHLALSLAAALVLLSCERSIEIPLVKLGVPEKNYMVEADGGNVNIPVYSNGAYHIQVLTPDSDWLRLHLPEKLSENGYIRAECDFNKSFRRQVVFLLCSDVDSRKDTVVFRQKGLLSATLAMSNRAIQTRGAGGDSTSSTPTSRPLSW